MTYELWTLIALRDVLRAQRNLHRLVPIKVTIV